LHHRVLFDKYHPGYFGKVGMRHLHYQKNQYHQPTINIDALWSLVSEQTRKQSKEAKPDAKVPVIDVTRAGFHKVLGKGKFPKQAVIVKAKFFTKKAENKTTSFRVPFNHRLQSLLDFVKIPLYVCGEGFFRLLRVLLLILLLRIFDNEGASVDTNETVE